MDRFLPCLVGADGFAAGRTSSTLLFLLLLLETEDRGLKLLVEGLICFKAALAATAGLIDLFEGGGVFI